MAAADPRRTAVFGAGVVLDAGPGGPAAAGPGTGGESHRTATLAAYDLTADPVGLRPKGIGGSPRRLEVIPTGRGDEHRA